MYFIKCVCECECEYEYECVCECEYVCILLQKTRNLITRYKLKRYNTFNDNMNIYIYICQHFFNYFFFFFFIFNFFSLSFRQDLPVTIRTIVFLIRVEAHQCYLHYPRYGSCLP